MTTDPPALDTTANVASLAETVDQGDSKTELFLLDVRPPHSEHVVEYLRDLSAVTAAAAVYSDFDVIAVVRGAQGVIDAIANEVRSDTPVDEIERFRVDTISDGSSMGSRQTLLRRSCTAFVRCKIRTPDVNMRFAVGVLARLQGVTRVFSNDDDKEAVLEIVAHDKRALDDTVMSTIQGHGGVVRSTRTFLTVDQMRWQREVTAPDARVFVGLAATDLRWAESIADRVERDMGIKCWLYSDIPIGTSSLTISADEATAKALLYIFVITQDYLKSNECQREFGKVEERANAEDICCIVQNVPFNELDLRYAQKWCLDAGDFFAYPRLLDWVTSRLAKSPATHLTQQ
jgi:hypothetical protein